MNKEQKEVLRKIIYAVETGGQVYGRQDYSDFTEAYTNSSAEYAITIGAGQWYATEAKTLLQRIHDADTALWDRLDTADVWEDVQSVDWSYYNISEGSAKAKCIVALISTATGLKCQDALLDEQMEVYVKEAADLGVTDLAGQAMCANFRHQGGLSAVKRILAKTAKPYTLNSLYKACQSDTGNQVGAYKSRQKFVYDSLKKYFPEEGENEVMANTKAINTLIKIAEGELGYLEKKSNSQLDSKTANAGSSNYTKYWRDIYPSYQAQPWCAAFVSWCMMKAFGLDTAKKLLKHWPYTYCPTLGDLFTKNANPKVGDIVIFYRGGTFAHTGIVTKISGDKFETIEGNTSGASGIVDNGGGVCRKSYYNSNLPGTKFCTPDYSIVKNTNAGSGTTSADEEKMNTVSYTVRMSKDTKCYITPGGSQAKLFPLIKKDAVVDVMQYTKKDDKGETWYFIRIPHPTEGFVFEFVPSGTFRHLK